MRQKIIDGLNELLEIDHDAIREVITGETIIKIDSLLVNNTASYGNKGVSVVSALSIINFCLDDDPIAAVFEGEIIQRFE